MATVKYSDPRYSGLRVGFEIDEDPKYRSPPGKQIVSGGGTTGEVYEWSGGGGGWSKTGIIVTGLKPGATTGGGGGAGDDSGGGGGAKDGETLATYKPPEDLADKKQAQHIRDEREENKSV